MSVFHFHFPAPFPAQSLPNQPTCPMKRIFFLPMCVSHMFASKHGDLKLKIIPVVSLLCLPHTPIAHTNLQNLSGSSGIAASIIARCGFDFISKSPFPLALGGGQHTGFREWRKQVSPRLGKAHIRFLGSDRMLNPRHWGGLWSNTVGVGTRLKENSTFLAKCFVIPNSNKYHPNECPAGT